MTDQTDLPVLKAKDFASDLEIRWCPGCGDYAILAQMKKILPSLGIPREKIVFISGIGCSSRFPYYLSTYGFHTVHGRAPTLATGLRLANQDLSVWVITGDGDGLSIGGNHLMHALRRNVNINIILFNNRIYGLTKGQYSPTSLVGHKTKSTPMGSLDRPLNPLSIAIGSQATFVARSVDTHIKHLGETLQRAAAHRGTSFVEVYQDCNVFNHGAFNYVSDKKIREENLLYLEHGKPLVFGKETKRGIRLNGFEPEVVEMDGTVREDDLLFHDEKAEDISLPFLLAQMRYPEFPEPIGVFREVDGPIYEDDVHAQVSEAMNQRGPGDLEKLFRSADTWTVE